MTASSFPMKPEQVTAAWLESVLDVAIANVEVKPISEGTGFAGSVYRVHLNYGESGVELPDTLIWKTVSGDERTRGFLTTLGVYEREARFYGQLASDIEMAPRPYFSDFDSDSGAFCLITEDVSYMRPGDQVEGCTFEEAMAVTQDVARFHSTFWTELPDERLNWVPAFDGGSGYFERMHSVAWRQLERSFDHVPRGLIEAAHRVAPRVSEIKTRLSRPPVTLVHGDLRLDNVFLGNSSATSGIKLIDWQAIRLGRGMYDLAYFLSTSIPVDLRRLRQDELMSVYLESLSLNGVTGYTLEACNEDFRWALLDIVTFVGVIGSTLDFQSDRGLELANTIMSRLSHALDDNSALDLLD